MTKILLIEDDPTVCEVVRLVLQDDFEIKVTHSAEEGRRVLLQEKQPDLILLDWMLPGVSGIEFMQEIKQYHATQSIPIVMLTARDAEADLLRGLEGGADDYISKPFSPRELAARIKVILRRISPHVTEAAVTVGQLQLDPATHRVLYGNNEVEIGPTEFRLLHFFMTHSEKVYSRARLLDRVWGTNAFVEERTVDVHIRRLRKALTPHQADGYIQTVWGAGYRFSINVGE
ncbi:MAG: phosphate regulon transcriptional regulator PhoB [Gammaproteobacteria bacterium]|nr:phosphate regulon transcriptional regulator PhoB [Gammaproteobacteria bacterium]